jgi:hypothetical protein
MSHSAFPRRSGGQTLDTAAIAFGKPIHALFDEWRDSVHQRYLWAPIGLLGLAVRTFCALCSLGWPPPPRQNRRRLHSGIARCADHVASALPYVPWPARSARRQPDEEAGDPRLPN